jgi:ATP-dependent RNA helicase DeaD
MNSFNELQIVPQLLRGVHAAGFDKPFPIQAQAISPLLRGLDVIGQARTGTGKTAAYALPLLQSISTGSSHAQALVLAPTRELAVQITHEVRRLGMYLGVKVLTVYGGQSIDIQLKGLRHGAHVIVGTPGRVIDHIKRGTLHLGSVGFVVLDEADIMLEMGFVDDVEFILDSMPSRKQMSLFSATMPERIIELSKRYMQDPVRILVDPEEPSVEVLKQYYAVVERDVKIDTMLELLNTEQPSSVIVFCRTKHGARRLAIDLQRRGLNAVALHGDLSQNQRDHSMNLFRSGRADILVATDVASRGIDISHVDCIINYDVPENPLVYFHRVGRTARAGNSGKAYTLISSGEFSDFARIRSFTKASIKPLRPDDEGHTFTIESNVPDSWQRRRWESRRSFGRYGRRRYR